jgi:hypothetical protein
MEKINVFETNSERFLREKVEKVCKEYLHYAQEITSGELAPNRVIRVLGEKFGMTGQGIKNILMRKGIYKSAHEPCIIPEQEPKSIPLAGSGERVPL